MVIETLLVTCDFELLRAIRAALEPFGINPNVRSDSHTAVEIATRRHFGGVIVDCDDLPEGAALLHRLRGERSMNSSTFIAVVNGRTTPATAKDRGANFVLSKPVTSEYAHRVLQVAMISMVRNCRQYFRHTVDLPASITTKAGHPSSVRIVNISDGGLAVESLRSQPLEGMLDINFDIPSIHRFIIQARAEVVWTDMRRSGMRFISMPPGARGKLEAWLNVLEEQEGLAARN